MWVLSPVNDVVSMQKKQSQCHFNSIKSGSSLIKFARFLHVKHQISTADVLHYEK